jgi:hypothetical protein
VRDLIPYHVQLKKRTEYQYWVRKQIPEKTGQNGHAHGTIAVLDEKEDEIAHSHNFTRKQINHIVSSVKTMQYIDGNAKKSR